MELLSPVGSFECLKAAVQNGADSVYFGAGSFNARAFANNFDLDNLKEAIFYAKSRGVKTNLTLNTLIKDEEFNDAFDLAKKAYEYGIDAIIVQDLGLAKCLIDSFPDLAIHASTQMSVHNLDGVLKLQKLGFKRVVLSRELSIDEINYICKHSDIEIECFIHGALCISYSGQCLFSSLVGGRSGNRGKCAQPCRLPYELFSDSQKINSGYLLSTRDVYGLPFIPKLLNSGVACFKIEGRMKSPEYVATVTRIYRKYIDLAKSNKEYIIDEKDKKDLLQVFNRGNFSSGHLNNEFNKNLIFKEKQNNMGLFLGKVSKYNSNKGHITLNLKESISIGDTISLENETGTYTISELMNNNSNLKTANKGQLVTIGRMKGNIHINDNIYKISSKELSSLANESFSKEYRKVNLACDVLVSANNPISIHITSANDLELYNDLDINCSLDIIPIPAENKPLTEEFVINQLSKTNNTKYTFKQINVNIDNNLFLPKSNSTLNELRRIALEQVDNYISNKLIKKIDNVIVANAYNTKNSSTNKKYSLLLNKINNSFDYTNIENIDCIYIPFRFFINSKYKETLSKISQKFNTYIYMPTVIRNNYTNLINNNLNSIIYEYHIKGIVISNISNFEMLENLDIKDLEIVSNYTLNVYNSLTMNKLFEYGANRITISPELDKNSIQYLANSNYCTETIVYSNTPLMNMNYCLLGESNKCYSDCKKMCINSNSSFYLKDRLGYKFEIVPDNIDTVTTLYNSKTTSISSYDINSDYFRIDILNENIDKINEIIKCVQSGEKLEGNSYTNGNLNREI